MLHFQKLAAKYQNPKRCLVKWTSESGDTVCNNLSDSFANSQQEFTLQFNALGLSYLYINYSKHGKLLTLIIKIVEFNNMYTRK
jgi:hypothetical protein